MSYHVMSCDTKQSTANNNWLDLGFSFTVVNTRGGQVCPTPIPDIPLVDTGATARNIQVFMGQHFFQCALWVNYQVRHHLIVL
jgi:hypothetical protein